MFDIIILVIIIKVVADIVKKQKEGMRGTSAKPNQPRRERWSIPGLQPGGRKKTQEEPDYGYDSQRYTKAEPKKDIMQQVNQQIQGTDASASDLEVYRRLIEEKRYKDIRTIAKERNCTMYQIIRDIQDFQEMGYFSNVEIDDVNYVLRYKDEVPKAEPVTGRNARQETNTPVQLKQTEAQKVKAAGRGKKSPQPEEVHFTAENRSWMQGTSYMTMPETGMKITYMTMPEDGLKLSYITMPEEGMLISYNTFPDTREIHG